MFTVINSAANENVKRWRKLAENPRAFRKTQTALSEGIHLAQVIVERVAPARNVIIRESAKAPEIAELAEILERELAARVHILADKLYEAVCPVENGTGIMVEVAVNLNDRPVMPLKVDALYLDGVQDAGNMGTLIRTALASGIRHIAASPGSAAFWAPKVLRAGMGAHFAVKLYENVRPEEIHSLFDAKILAADARGGLDLFRSSGWEEGNTVWMMGAEGPGLSHDALSVAHARYLIPIEDDCESLNVGAAAAVCLFEQRRRRLLKGA